jgi:hypothetical protein
MSAWGDGPSGAGHITLRGFLGTGYRGHASSDAASGIGNAPFIERDATISADTGEGFTAWRCFSSRQSHSKDSNAIAASIREKARLPSRRARPWAKPWSGMVRTPWQVTQL